MLADKMRNVLSTGAEALSAGDSSCLMHIGGGMSRLRSGTQTVHLAEILASTDAPAPDRESARGAGVPAPDDDEIGASPRTPTATGGSPA
jgi:L-lactate dehydrogenase complex protein LldE